MKKTVITLFAVLALAVSVTGCSTIKYNDPDNPYAGKVWRVQVRDKLIVFADTDALRKEFSESESKRQVASDLHLSLDRLSRTRSAPFILKTPGVFGHITTNAALVPDNIASEDMRPGAIVDVVYEKTLDYSKNQFNRVIRLVCKSDDDACLDRVKKDGTLFSVLDANPTPGDLHGLTYDHKVTKEEEQRYLQSLK